jgi:hypothetical protein
MRNQRIFAVSMFMLVTISYLASQVRNEKFASLSIYQNDNDHAIRRAIIDNIFNLNPLEYAYALPELCQLIREKAISTDKFEFYIDSLSRRAKKIDSNPLTSIYAIETKGLLQRQILFLVSTIKNNKEILQKFEMELGSILKCIESKLSNPMPITSVKISDEPGETNFWYLLQIDDCDLIERLIKEEASSKEMLKIISSNLNMTSTFKAPYSLQKRKLRDLQTRLKMSKNAFCLELSEALKKTMIVIEDENVNYFKEHPDWHLFKEF